MSTDSSSSSNYKLGYWDIKGLASPIRMAFAYARIPYEDVFYTCTKDESTGRWTSNWKYSEMEGKLHSFPNLPYLVLPGSGGEVVVQSSAILRHVGRVGKLGTTEMSAVRSDEVIEQLSDVRREIVDASYGDYAKTKPDLIEKTFPYALRTLENYVTKIGGPYITGNEVTVADFYAFDVLDLIDKHSEGSLLPNYPKLNSFYKTILALPQLNEFFSSALWKLPYNNKMAAWGSS
eukprot:PhF_6_TR31761/c0_g1_i1/m.46761/K00799/GST, gst; glutathione S-transferase